MFDFILFYYYTKITGYTNKRNSYETATNNKENSPYNYRMMQPNHQNQNIPPSRFNLPQQSSSINNNNPQPNRGFNSSTNTNLIDPPANFANTNKYPTALIDSPPLPQSSMDTRVSPPKPPANYKYGNTTSQFSTSNGQQQKSTSSLTSGNPQAQQQRTGYINPNLAAATAAAAAALNAVNNSNNGTSRSKMMRSENNTSFNMPHLYQNPHLQHQHSFNEGNGVSVSR